MYIRKGTQGAIVLQSTSTTGSRIFVGALRSMATAPQATAATNSVTPGSANGRALNPMSPTTTQSATAQNKRPGTPSNRYRFVATSRLPLPFEPGDSATEAPTEKRYPGPFEEVLCGLGWAF